MLEHSQALKVIYEKRLALQQIWVKTSSNGHDMLAAIKDWVHEAEASGIQSLRDFADQLKNLLPAPCQRLILCGEGACPRSAAKPSQKPDDAFHP
ncbi:transposase [Pseudomonas lini]